ncbi:MAG TPA: hypothetical protein VFC63_14245 [Blastocatellia bacterium]|nr:hypothetical protein [Blastocatellia bacterium]
MLQKAVERSEKLKEGQTNCTVKDEKGKPCHGYLKEWGAAPSEVTNQIAKGNVVLRCSRCGALYESEPHNHLRPRGKD